MTAINSIPVETHSTIITTQTEKYVTSTTSSIPNTIPSNSSCTQTDKWITVKCVFFKFKNNGTGMIFQKKEIINNTDLCNKIDPDYQKAIIEARNKARDEKKKEIEEKALNDIKTVNEKYKKEIIANKSFGYIAIISITVLISFIIIMDFTKLYSFKKNFKKVSNKNSKSKSIETENNDDSLVYNKVRNYNSQISKKLNNIKL
jgi:hypothetical protein